MLSSSKDLTFRSAMSSNIFKLYLLLQEPFGSLHPFSKTCAVHAYVAHQLKRAVQTQSALR